MWNNNSTWKENNTASFGGNGVYILDYVPVVKQNQVTIKVKKTIDNCLFSIVQKEWFIWINKASHAFNICGWIRHFACKGCCWLSSFSLKWLLKAIFEWWSIIFTMWGIWSCPWRSTMYTFLHTWNNWLRRRMPKRSVDINQKVQNKRIRHIRNHS